MDRAGARGGAARRAAARRPRAVLREVLRHGGGRRADPAGGGPGDRRALDPERRGQRGEARAGARAPATCWAARSGSSPPSRRRASSRTPSAGISSSGRWTGGRPRAPGPSSPPARRPPSRPSSCGDVTRALWEKYVFLTTHAGMTALTRCPAGVLRAVPEMREIYRRTRDEMPRDRQGRGRDARRRACWTQGFKFLDTVAPNAFSSLHHDLVHGKRLELEALHGHAVRLGRAPRRAHAHRLRGLRGAAARIGTARPPLPRASGGRWYPRPGWRRRAAGLY